MLFPANDDYPRNDDFHDDDDEEIEICDYCGADSLWKRTARTGYAYYSTDCDPLCFFCWHVDQYGPEYLIAFL